MPRRSFVHDDFEDDDLDQAEFDGEGGVDSGPSREDIERFSGEEALCSECGAEVWDGASVCPKCGAILVGGPSHRPPLEQWWRRRWMVVIVVVLVLSLASILPLLLRRG